MKNPSFLMRNFIFLSLVFYSLTVSAQNYKVFQWNTPHFFGGQYDIRAIMVDSIEVNGTDTLYYNFFTIDEYNPDSNNCVNIFGPSWIGQKILVRSDSLIIFFNYFNDSLFLRPLDSVGSTWMFNSTGILATVTNIAPIIINSLPDSIKTISLSNGKEIIISKNNGFYKLFSFRDFPTNSDSYTLNDQLQLTIGKVYDFDIGDTLQYETYIIPGFANPPYPPHNYFTKIFTGKSISTNGDTIVYTYSTQTIINNLVQDSTGTHIVTSITNGSGGDTYSSLNTPIMDKMPEEADTLNGIAYSNRMFFNNCGVMVENRSGDYVFNPFANCYPAPFEPTITIGGYGSGLGYTGYAVVGCTACGNLSYYYNRLSGFHKANLSCGNIQYYTGFEELNSNKHDVKIYPTPIPKDGHFYIDKNDNKKSLLELFDVSGKLLFSKLLIDRISTINISEIEPGLYFYRLTYSDNFLQSGKIIK